MSTISIGLNEEEVKILEKRAEDNLLTLKEQIEDIIRRSCISSSKKTGYSAIKCDDKLVAVFSRDKRGRKKKSKTKTKTKSKKK